jgi:hypothetical protein
MPEHFIEDFHRYGKTDSNLVNDCFSPPSLPAFTGLKGRGLYALRFCLELA